MVILAIEKLQQVAPAALWLAAVLVLGAGGIWLVRKWRGDDAEDTQDAHLALAKFRELHARGGLSDEEYRTIKTKLATQLEAELETEHAVELGNVPPLTGTAATETAAEPGTETGREEETTASKNVDGVD